MLSVALRMVAFVELNKGPSFWLHRWHGTDMHFFDLWARTISEGDVLTDRSLHPYSPWHQRLSREFIRRYPEKTLQVLGRRVADPDDPEASRALWDRWYGGKRLHQGPLYPYSVALTYKMLGHDPRWVFAWQLALGALANALIFLIAYRHFGALVGTVSGFLAVLCAPMLFYETVLLRSALILFFGVLLVYLADQALARQTTWRWGITGAALGLAMLLKSTFASLGLGFVALLFYRFREQPKRLILPTLALAGSTLFVLIPLVVRNAKVGAPLTSSTSVGAITFACANTVDYRPKSGFSISEYFVPAIFAQTDGHFGPTVVETLKTHPSALSWIKQLWGKFVFAGHWYEKPNNTNFYYARLHSAVLRYLPITFWFLAPMGLLGLVLGVRRAWSLATLYLLVLTHLAPLLLFYGLSRFRAPLASALVPFAAVALVSIAGWLISCDWKRLAFACAGLVLVMLSTAKPIDHPLISAAYYHGSFTIFYTPSRSYLVRAASASGRVEDWRFVARFIEDSLRTEPVTVKRLGPERTAQDRAEAELARMYSEARQELSQALAKTGDLEGARRQARRAEELRAAAAVRLDPQAE